MAAELPKQDLLAKLLKMTASPNDGEALAAVRKANNLLASAGWDWDKLISGKITVVADPFANVGTPQASDGFHAAPTPPQQRWQPSRAAPSPPPRPQPPLRPTPAPQAAQPQRAKSTPIQPYSTRTNNYGGWCYCCGIQVPGLAGFIIKPKDEHVALPSNAMTTKWQIICAPCNKTRALIMPSPSRRQHASTSPTGTPDLYTL